MVIYIFHLLCTSLIDRVEVDDADCPVVRACLQTVVMSS
jgi:hypothetical protein